MFVALFLGLLVFYLKNQVYSLAFVSLLAIVMTVIPKKTKILNGVLMGISSLSIDKSIIRLKIGETKTYKIIISNSVLDNVVLHESISVEISYLGEFIRLL